MTKNSTMHCLSSQINIASILPPALIIEFLLGIPGNAIALWVFCFRMKVWRPSTVYLLNLVLADFLLILCLPFRIDNLLRGEHWVFGDPLCRINLFMLAANRSASISFMTVVAAERYFKIVHPHRRINRLSVKQASMMSCGVWVLILSLRIPLLTSQLLQEHNGTFLCRSFSSYSMIPTGILLHYFLYVVEFFLPFSVLLFCTLRITWVLKHRSMNRDRKIRNAIRVVSVIMLVFALCFGPGIVTGLTTLLIKQLSPGDCVSFRLASECFSASIAFTYLNSVLDPLIYCFSCTMFRNTLKKSISYLGLCQLEESRRGSVTSVT
ncbi:hydroxycarboxylic acid receptor 2-like [Polyodon spathula]|uniref:hydroxycarboxylic acid receptor 2-like n=1 Tax=Polyodon spathula TaxID=7913 RepID=UPI001B7DF932|nr:hydroxycarboxylic acid receptor 2-like [Polyodon spathula]